MVEKVGRKDPEARTGTETPGVRRQHSTGEEDTSEDTGKSLVLGVRTCFLEIRTDTS